MEDNSTSYRERVKSVITSTKPAISVKSKIKIKENKRTTDQLL